ncbi:MAG TPA: GreA/GreB family elongation factor [Spirochaetales bacterium]|nr:GreA/GreB family elongation factor [Spirochaetales bacterium]
MSDTILLGLPDHRKLSGIVSAMKARRVALAPHLLKLEGELKHAIVVGEPELPDNVVSIGSTVKFEDLATGGQHYVRIVFPAELDGTEGTTSVLAPLGCALIGERAGSSISCQTPSGERLIRVLMVNR